MKKFRSIIWFRKPISSKKVASGLGDASSVIQSRVSVISKNEHRENHESVWGELINGFEPHEYSGEVKWQINSASGSIKGSVTWPIVNPGDLPSTVEFGFNFDPNFNPRKRLKTYSFHCPHALLDFLMPVCCSVRSISMVIEPQIIPEDLAEKRYERFKRLHGKYSLTNIDWIFGLPSNDAQSRRLAEVDDDLFAFKKEMGDFTLYCVKNEPLNYDDEEDMQRLSRIENIMGVSD